MLYWSKECELCYGFMSKKLHSAWPIGLVQAKVSLSACSNVDMTVKYILGIIKHFKGVADVIFYVLNCCIYNCYYTLH